MLGFHFDLFHLSAVFDMLDASILLAHLHGVFSMSGKAFEWFSSYLSERFESVSITGWVSSQMKLCFGVPQGSILGPILITLYAQPLSGIISQGRCHHHKSADNTQLHQSTPSDFHTRVHNMEQCVDSWEIDDWQYSEARQ